RVRVGHGGHEQHLQGHRRPAHRPARRRAPDGPRGLHARAAADPDDGLRAAGGADGARPVLDPPRADRGRRERPARPGPAMSGGLVALLDDISVLARAAAASVDDVSAAAGRASTKAAGVVVDDAAVTPRYVDGLDPKRELPIIKRITIGSLRNKIVLISPAILLINAFVPWLLSPMLMLGGTYLCFEGAEKIWEKLSG